MERKKVVLAAVNAKYIHSNPAIYSLKANAGEYSHCVTLCEYTINHRREEILADLYEEKPDLLGFSCYIWNIEYITFLAGELKKICPAMRIVVGGPEVSYRPEQFLRENPCVDLVMVGEGERTFAKLLEVYLGEEGTLADIRGIVYRQGENLHRTPAVTGIPMDDIRFPYEDLEGMENRILYYESIRGCPFSCSYCLSSIEKSVRIKSLEKTRKEIDFFLRAKVPQVKFVDRTFNCNHEHAYGVWSYLLEKDNGVTNFHFEIAGDLFHEEDFELLARLRPGLVQFEIGVQSTNPDTLREIRRVTDFEKLRHNIKKIQEGKNIHIHLDLIAGLPFEDYNRFKTSFNDVYAMRPDQLQLGFLKVLDGSYMNEKKEEYGVVYSALPPYEVYATNWLSYEEVRKLKQVEEMVEVYYNSFQFVATMAYLEPFFPDAFSMYRSLGRYYKENGLFEKKHSRISRYEILWEFAGGLTGPDREILRETLTYDLYSRDYVKNPPAFVRKRNREEKEVLLDMLQSASETGILPEEYEGFSAKQLYNMLYVDRFCLDLEVLIESGKVRKTDRHMTAVFDYKHRSSLDHGAGVLVIRSQNIPE